MPYAPTERNRVGEFLLQGITGAADNLAQGIREWRKNKEESGGFDTLIEGAVRADPTLAEKYGDQLAKAPGMSLSQKKSLAGTLALETQNKRLAEEQRMKQEDFNLRKAYLDLQRGQMDRTNAREDSARRFTQTLAGLAGTGGQPSMDFANTLAGEPQPARDLGLADIIRAASESGLAMEPTGLAPLLRAENMDRRASLGDAMPVPFTAGSLSGVYSPKTGQFQVDNPAPVAKPPRVRVQRDPLTGQPTYAWSGDAEQFREQFGIEPPVMEDKPAAEAKPLTRDLASDFLKQAGGDKAKARELARKAGYTF